MKLSIYSYGADIKSQIRDNRLHSHDCIQMSKALSDSSINIDGVALNLSCGDILLLNNRVKHQLEDGEWHNILIDNESQVVQTLINLLGEQSFLLVNSNELVLDIFKNPKVHLSYLNSDIRAEVREAIKIISTHTHNCSLDEVSKMVGLSSERLRKVFKDEVKISYVNFLKWQKIKKAFWILKENNPKKLVDIAYLSGFFDQAHMSKVIKETFGNTPKEIKKNL